MVSMFSFRSTNGVTGADGKLIVETRYFPGNDYAEALAIFNQSGYVLAVEAPAAPAAPEVDATLAHAEAYVKAQAHGWELAEEMGHGTTLVFRRNLRAIFIYIDNDGSVIYLHTDSI